MSFFSNSQDSQSGAQWPRLSLDFLSGSHNPVVSVEGPHPGPRVDSLLTQFPARPKSFRQIAYISEKASSSAAMTNDPTDVDISSFLR